MKRFITVVTSIITIYALGMNFIWGADKPDQPLNKTAGHTTPAATVEMTNTLKFSPDTVRIKKGATVRWKNTSVIVHSVTADPTEATVNGSVQLPAGAEPFNSGLMDPKQTFEHTFTVAGTYQYFCIPHEGTKMFGWVIVK